MVPNEALVGGRGDPPGLCVLRGGRLPDLHAIEATRGSAAT
jgi:hypothetical protein